MISLFFFLSPNILLYYTHPSSCDGVWTKITETAESKAVDEEVGQPCMKTPASVLQEYWPTHLLGLHSLLFL